MLGNTEIAKDLISGKEGCGGEKTPNYRLVE